MEVKETGVYKIDRNYLQQAGINVSGINPSTIKIYGNGGQELPFQNSTLVPTDLVENPIYIKTEVPGQFGNNDYILFLVFLQMIGSMIVYKENIFIILTIIQFQITIGSLLEAQMD